jgi:hypothetical protein
MGKIEDQLSATNKEERGQLSTDSSLLVMGRLHFRVEEVQI